MAINSLFWGKNNRLFYNTISGLINQIVMLICTFILPRQILLYYGSDVNGLVSSITQFLGFIALMEMGVGAVVESALYKPLVSKNTEQIAKILKSAQSFFNKLAIILILYVCFLLIFYPIFTHSKFSYSFIIPLILALSLNSFASYYFGLTKQLLLSADQRAYICLLLNSVVVLTNTAIGVLLIHMHASIQLVQIAMSLILLIRPIGLCLFAKKYYKLPSQVIIIEEPIKQKWNGLAQHISIFILGHTDIMLLTIFSTLANVSVYSVYYMVVAGIRKFVAIAMTGVYSWFGHLYASKDPSLETKFAYYEWIMHTAGTILFTVAGILIVPFVLIYTFGVNDADYNRPVFAFLLLFAYAMFTIRLPYLTLILAIGHYKETQHISILEAILNILISIIGVQIWGICGVALGTLIAMTYCTTAMAIYLRRNVIKSPTCHLWKHYAVDILCVLLILGGTSWLKKPVYSYLSWCIMATKITFLALVIGLGINRLFYPNEIKFLFTKLTKLLKFNI